LPALASDFTLPARVIEMPAVRITLPAIEVRGADRPQEAFERLLDPAAPEPWASRLTRLTAARIGIPELSVEMTLFGQRIAWRHRDIVLSDVRSGRFGEVRAAGGEGRSSDPAMGEVSYGWGPVSAIGFDAAGIVATASATRPAGQAAQFRELIGTVRVERFVQTQGPGVTLTQGVNEWRSFAMSPGVTPFADRLAIASAWLARTSEAEKAGKPPPKLEPALMADLISLWDDVRLGTSVIDDMRLTFAANRAKGIEEAGEIGIRRMSFSDTGDASANALSLEGLAGQVGAVKLAVQRMSLTGFSLAPAFAALRADIASGVTEPKGEALARYVPRLGRIQIAGVAVEAPDSAPRRAGAPPPALLRMGLGELDMHVRAQENGWPVDLRLAVERLSAPIPPGDASSQPLLGLGYREVELSSRLDLGWDQGRSEIALREFGFDGRDMLTFRLGGTIGNAGKDLFAPDLALAQVAALGLTVKALQARLENLGLFDRFLESEARKAGKEPAALRRDWGAMAAIAIPAMLGDSPAAKTIASAVARFVARPGTLSLSATAPAGGIGLADVIALGDPKAVLGKIEVKADAQ
jgi:hypothetical protein